jgi:trehalose 6-phosphate phosphatase
LHYRAVPEREAEVLAVAERLHRSTDPDLRLIRGKLVAEFVPRDANKGRAIAAFLAELPFLGRRPVFIGDDATDEDGFATVNQRGGIAVRVGPASETAAPYRLPSVAAVLAWLVDQGNL